MQVRAKVAYIVHDVKFGKNTAKIRHFPVEKSASVALIARTESISLGKSAIAKRSMYIIYNICA